MDPEPYDVYAVELSSFQLHYTSSMSALSAAVLNVAEDHLDWYGSLEDYAADKGRIYERRPARPASTTSPTRSPSSWSRDADVVEGARAVGFTLGTPAVGMVGVVDDVLADRAFVDEREHSAAELCTVADLAAPAPHIVANALAAAALARVRTACPPPRSATGSAPSRPTATASPTVGEVAAVRYVDDSKATNPHAATSSLQAYDPVVWVAGGLAKGASFDDLVTAVRSRLRGAVLLGRDRARHRRGACATRARCPGDRSATAGTLLSWTAWSGGGGPGTARRHRAAGPRVRVHGHVRELRRTRGCLRGVGTPAPRPVSTGRPRPAPRRQGGRRVTDHGRGAAQARRGTGSPGSAGRVGHALDRPLTSYYLLLGASTLLLTIGLMEVLSASSVYSYRIFGNSYHVFLKQLTWVLLGAAASRSSPRGCRTGCCGSSPGRRCWSRWC